MLKSSLCDYKDVYILVSRFMLMPQLAEGGDNNNIQVVFENLAPFFICISKISNT